MSNKEIESLMEIAHKNQTSERVFTFLALRMRHRKVLNLYKAKRFLEQCKEIINDTEFKEVFDSLQKAGYGKFKNTREFEFNHPMYQIGRAALEGKAFSDVNKPLDRPIKNPTYDVKHLEDNKKYHHESSTKETVSNIPQAMPYLVSKSATDRTVVYFKKGSKYAKVTVEGEISTEELDSIVATLESKPVSA